jgi:hypothetical protein
MAFREVAVTEIREALRAWLEGRRPSGDVYWARVVGGRLKARS